MRTYYDFIFEKNGYNKQYLASSLPFYYKDIGIKYKTILLINNQGQNSIALKRNLSMLKAQIRQLPCFLYDKEIEFMVILFHIDKEDRVRFREQNLIQFGADYKDRYYHISDTFRDEVKALQLYRLESKRSEQYKNRYINRNKTVYPIVSLLLSLICISVYIKGTNQLDYGLSVSNLANGKYNTLITYAFVHAGLLHLIGNVISLLVIGSILERQLGNVKYSIFTIAAIIYTGTLSVGYKIATKSDITTVGISGVIYAMMGCLIVWRLINRERSNFIITYTVICLFKGALLPSVDTAIHIMGLIAGIIIAIALIVLNQLVEQGKYIQYVKTHIQKQRYKAI